MTWPTYLLAGAAGAYAVTLAVRLFAPRHDASWDQVAARAYAWGAGLTTASLLVLSVLFLLADLSYAYVHSYTQLDYPWYYKMVGLWGGNEGTLVMWTAFLALAAWAMDWKLRRATPAADAAGVTRLRLRLQIVLSGLVLLFLAVTLVSDPFAATEPYLLQVQPNGNGLQPVLLTPFMIIHPPMQFVAYALTGLLFAGAVVNIATGDRRWAPAVRPWARLAFLVSTFGLGLGGLWAYYTLNFGGFWAWDPVETANLLAWFPVAILLHTLLYYERGRFPTAAPLFGALTLPAALFATVATRTGLWVSVHAFTDPSKSFARDPFQRFLFILETGELLQALTALFFASLVAAVVAVGIGRVRNMAEPGRTRWRTAWVAVGAGLVALLFLQTLFTISAAFQLFHWLSLGQSTLVGLVIVLGGLGAWIALGGPTDEAPRPTAGRGMVANVTARNVFAAGVLLLSLGFLVAFLLTMMAVNGYSREPYDARAPWVALPILLAMGLLFLLPWLGPKRGVMAAGGALLAGLAGFLILPDHWEVALTLPALALAGTGALWRILKTSRKPGGAEKRSRVLGAVLVVGGLAGMLYWANPPSTLRLPGYATALPWGWAVPGFLAAMGAIACGVLLRGRDDRAVARVGALLLIPAFAYGLGVLAGIAVLAFAQRLPAALPGRASWVERNRETLRKSAIYTLHLVLVLGLVGYAFATYESVEAPTLIAFGQGEPAGAFAGYAFQIVDTERVDPAADGTPDEFRVHVQVYRDGEPLGPATLVFWKVPDDVRWHYDAKTTVVRYASQDLYLFPTVLEFEDGETLVDHSEGIFPPDGDVVGVRSTAKVLPGMSLLWMGLFGITGLMAANLALGGFATRWPAAAASGPAAKATGAGGEAVRHGVPAP